MHAPFLSVIVGSFPEKDTTITGSPTSTGVNDGLAVSETNVTMGSINHKTAEWVKVENGWFVTAECRKWV